MPPSRGGILKGSAAVVLLCAFAFIFTSYHVVHRSSSTLRTTLVAASGAPSYARNGGNNT
ncbi:hypothetical protein EON66_07950 [archaeon]|nr:MAG: hypothetical protein EON66_07950 [archaeon]